MPYLLSKRSRFLEGESNMLPISQKRRILEFQPTAPRGTAGYGLIQRLALPQIRQIQTKARTESSGEAIDAEP